MTPSEMTEHQRPQAAHVLVVEDAPEFVEMLVPLLERDGYSTSVARDGKDALRAAADHPPDVVVLDLTLPELDGVEVCRQLRTFSDAYIVMLTSRSDEVDRILGLEVGADDYITKPFSPRELTARVRAMLRRPRLGALAAPQGIRRVAGIELDPAARRVHIDGEEIALTRIEFDLLDALTSLPGTVRARSELQREVWGPDWYGDDHVVDVHIANLRKKIDASRTTSRITTVRGVGYRVDP